MTDQDPDEGYSVMDGYLVLVDEDRPDGTGEGRRTVDP